MKENINDTFHELLVKYLLGEASSSEQATVQEWLESDKENDRYFRELQTIWATSKQLAPVVTIDENEAWQRFRRKREEKLQSQAVVLPRTRKFNWLRIAAVFILLAGIAYSVYYFQFSKEVISSGNNVLVHTLPDGSTITLNKHTSLSYSRRFTNKKRLVALNGEAFFSITPDREKPFIITANEVSVKVTGTSFNVKSTDEGTEVVVETGSVDVSKNGYAIQLRANEKAMVAKGSQRPVKIGVDNKLYNYYRTNQFICNNTPLHQLVDILNEAYNANIIIANESVADLPLTTTFRQESLDGILNIIAQTFNIRIEKRNGQIILK